VADRLVNDGTVLNFSIVYKNAEGTHKSFDCLDILSSYECFCVSLELGDSFSNCGLVTLTIFSLFCSSGGASAFTSDSFVFKQIVDVLLKVSGSWVTHECNFTGLVNEENVGNTTRSVSLRGLACTVSNVIMLNSLPSLSLNVFLNSWSIIIDTETDNSDIATPLLLVISKHFLVVCHGSLARRAPGSPQIVQNDLTIFVLDSSLAILEDKVSTLNRSDLITSTNLCRVADLLVGSRNTLKDISDLLSKFSSNLGLVSLDCTLSLENKLSLERLAGNVSDELINQLRRFKLLLNIVLLVHFVDIKQELLSLLCTEIGK